jgi:hypothetical protein
MKAPKLFLLGVVLLTTSHAMAWSPFESKLQLYKCDSQASANSCGSGCVAVEGAKYIFKVNVEKSVVMRTAFKDGVNAGTVSFENCSVVDSKNWACKRDVNETGTFLMSRDSMGGGLYTSWSIFKITPVPKGAKPAVELFGCAK